MNGIIDMEKWKYYDKQGKHKGSYSPKTGKIKPPVKGRRIEK